VAFWQERVCGHRDAVVGQFDLGRHCECGQFGHIRTMADDAHIRLREVLGRAEKRVLAWVGKKRPDLKNKAIQEVIATLRDEDRKTRPQLYQDAGLDPQTPPRS
jgi:hypothetical protein